VLRGPGSLLYPEALLEEAQLPDKDGLAIAASDVRALALRCDDFHEVCEDDAELGEVLLAALAAEIATRRSRPSSIAPRLVIGEPKEGLESAPTDPNMRAVGPPRKTERKAESSHPPSVAAVVPSVPKPASPRLGKSTTPASGRPTAPMGMVGIGTAATIPPPTRDTLPGVAAAAAVANRAPTVLDDRSPQDRASTVPEDSDAIPVVMPRTDTKNGPAVAPRLASSPGERLIVPQSEAGLANDQLDEAFDDLSRDPVKRHEGPDGMRPPARLAKLPLPAPIMEESEVLMEAEEPPTLEKGPSQIAGMKTRAIGDHSEPEISIERFVELEVEEPMNESSSEGSAPEIMIVTPGRAITADDTHLVSGSIDSEDTSERAAKK
jgi:hypothetical protein